MLIAASASYATVAFTTTSTLNFIQPNARTGPAGNIQLSSIGAGTVGGAGAADTLTITYGGAQISELTTPVVTFTFAGVPTAIPTPAGYTYGTVIAAGPNINIIVNPTNVSISFLALGATPFAAGDSILISGVRLNVVPVTAGSTVGGQINATLSSVAGLVTVTNPSLPIATIAKGIQLTTPGASTLLKPPATFSTGSVAIGPTTYLAPPTAAQAEVIVGEVGAFTNAFETNGAIQPTQLILTITGIPTGLSLRINSAASGGLPISPAIDFGGAPARTSGAPLAVAVDYTKSVQSGSTATVVINISGQSSTSAETIAVSMVFTASGGTLPLGTGSVTATLGPDASSTQLANIAAGKVGIPFGGGATAADGPIVYFNNPEPPITFVQVIQLTTELLSVYNVSIPNSYETGYSVSNTSGWGGVTSQTDVITVTLQPADGSAATVFTTSATNKDGIGLNSAGQLAPGASWIVTLGQLLKIAGLAPGFQGQVRFTCNFTNGHGLNFIYNANSAQGFGMLVLNPVGFGGRPTNAFESVGQ